MSNSSDVGLFIVILKINSVDVICLNQIFFLYNNCKFVT